MTTRSAPKRCFARDYTLGALVPMRELERRVLGSDYGATSWTTRDEALKVARLLALRPGMRLLDVGAGAGWPGLYLALVSRCDVVLSDIPLVALRIALDRAAQDGTAARCHAAVADGASLPFADGLFDAISHSDVLCCMAAKREMLAECRRVARDGARMAFSVIAPAAGLSKQERQLAIDSGPEFVDVDDDYPTLLEQSGWRVQQRIDVTDVFTESIRTSLALVNAHAAELTATVGDDECRERVRRREVTLAGLERRVLVRELFAATTGERPLG